MSLIGNLRDALLAQYNWSFVLNTSGVHENVNAFLQINENMISENFREKTVRIGRGKESQKTNFGRVSERSVFMRISWSKPEKSPQILVETHQVFDR